LITKVWVPKHYFSRNIDLEPVETAAPFETLVPSYHSSVVKVRPLNSAAECTTDSTPCQVRSLSRHSSTASSLCVKCHLYLLKGCASRSVEARGDCSTPDPSCQIGMSMRIHAHPCPGHTSADSTARISRCQIPHLRCLEGISVSAVPRLGDKEPADLTSICWLQLSS